MESSQLPEGNAPIQKAVALRPPAINVTLPSDKLVFFNSRVNTSYELQNTKNQLLNNMVGVKPCHKPKTPLFRT